MDAPNIPDSLIARVHDAILPALTQAVNEAYASGYLRGADDVTQRIVAAATGASLKPHNAISSACVEHVIPRPLRREAHPNSADARRFPYGAVSEAFREALKSAGMFGIKHDDLIAKVSVILGQDVSDMDHRDTIKRLKQREHLRATNGRYFAGPKLRSENGAPATLPLSAPEAGGGATPPVDSEQVTDPFS